MEWYEIALLLYCSLTIIAVIINNYKPNLNPKIEIVDENRERLDILVERVGILEERLNIFREEITILEERIDILKGV